MKRKNKNLPESENDPSSKSDAQLHYEALTSYLKYALGITGILIGTLASVALYITSGSLKEMKSDVKAELTEAKDNYTATIKSLSAQISDLKAEASETVGAIKQDARTAVASTESFSEKELSRISSSTNQIALNETQKQLDYIFGTDKIQSLIQNQAVNEVKKKVVDIINERTINMGDISDAAAELRAYKFSGRYRLRTYFTNHKNSTDSLIARQLYEQISKDFERTIEVTVSDNLQLVKEMESDALVKLKQGILVQGSRLAEQISIIMRDIHAEDYNLYNCLVSISRLRTFTDISFHILDIEGVEEWYKNLKK